MSTPGTVSRTFVYFAQQLDLRALCAAHCFPDGQPCSTQVGMAKKLLMRYEWWRLEPHPEWVEPHWTARDYLQAYGRPGVAAPYGHVLPASTNTKERRRGGLL